MITFMKSNALDELKSFVEANLNPAELTFSQELERRFEVAAIQRQLGNQVKEKRTELGWSQRHIAKILGISQREICHLEQGKSNPTLSTQVKILSVLGLKLEITQK